MDAIRAGIGAIKASAGAIRKNICDQESFIITLIPQHYYKIFF
ncbi:hypothetical protein M078_4022 [Bacteroides fragilis str. 2-F-2 |nr:hypothetical protein M078_5123 [Bacteroides fragilis str. 2-F-2 \